MSDSDPKPVPNIEYLGRCYDVLKTDPMNLGETSLPTVFDFTGATYRVSVGYDVPAGVIHSAPSSTRFVTESKVVSSTFEWQDEARTRLEMNAGIDGVFEFSASTSFAQVEQGTESRKFSYLYARCYRVQNIVKLDLLNRHAPLALSEDFKRMVADLPPPDAPEAEKAYDDFVAEYGTHFTTEIHLGGAAVQTTRAQASRVLRTKDTESTFTAKASGVIEAVSAGASVDTATKNHTSTDKAEEYTRTDVSFQGGVGSTTGAITDEWLQSVAKEPVIVNAKFSDITSLLTARWFPDDEFIDDKQALVAMAIRERILARGKRGDVNRPLRYGEPLVMLLARSGSGETTLAFPEIRGNGPTRLAYPAERTDPRPTAVVLEPYDKERAGRPVLSGDAVRIKLLVSGKYAGPHAPIAPKVLFDSGESDAALLRILRGDDTPSYPKAPGLCFTEMDTLQFAPAINAQGSYLVGVDPKDGTLATGLPAGAFRLMRVPMPGSDPVAGLLGAST